MRTRLLLVLIATAFAAGGCRTPGHGTERPTDGLTADLYKPDHARTAEIDPYLAPFILHAVEAPDDPPAPFGALIPAGDGGVLVDPAAPAVYVRNMQVPASGGAPAQLEFSWFYPGDAGAGAAAQGLRVTLAANGIPAAYEAFARADGKRHVFHPETPPQPMGPNVFLRGREHRIADVRCRCSASPVDTLREDRLYELRPAAELKALSVPWPWD